jgi:hypothetical protein
LDIQLRRRHRNVGWPAPLLSHVIGDFSALDCRNRLWRHVVANVRLFLYFKLWFSKRNLAVLLFTLAPLPGNTQTPPDNLRMFLQLFDRVAHRVAEQIAGDGGAAIWVQPPASEQPEERFFFNRLVTILGDTLSVPIFTEPVDSLQSLALRYRLFRCEMVYRPVSGRGSRSQRTASVLIELGGREAKTRQVRFQRIWTESAVDTVAEKSMASLEEASLPFTVGRWEGSVRKVRWLEPALITSATGVVVYLFFALRSR